MKVLLKVFCLYILLLGTSSYPSDGALSKHRLEDDYLKSVVKEWREKLGDGERKGPKTLVDLPCSALLNQSTIDEIQTHQSEVDQIINVFTNGSLKGKTFEFLAEMTDTFGPRYTGTVNLDQAIDWILDQATFYGYENVYTEPVTAPLWVRGVESLMMTSPRLQVLPLLGLGNSVGTPPEGIAAEVLVVTSFDDLAAKGDQADGRIVLYNVPFTTYGETAPYRAGGADEAAKYGAVASLVRSVTDFSIATPHTGGQTYSGNVTQIPTAAITIEDSEMISRITKRGQIVTLNLTMGSQNLGTVETRNTILEIPGTISPEEVVVVSGHLDSWDVGVGAMDDGGGVTVGFMAGLALQKLGLTPSRTFRVVMFTAEEQKIFGGEAYFLAHGLDRDQFQIMMESDFGAFNPLGIAFSGTDVATCIMQSVVQLTEALQTTQVVSPADTPDLEAFGAVNVPLGSLHSESDRYFWFHHTAGDRMEVLDSDAMDRVSALWTSVSYVLAKTSVRLPHF